jgi:hypothetical protein
VSKDIVAKTGEYTNREGETKSEWTKIGVILSNQNGEYMLLDPTVNLAGVLTKQNMLAAEKHKAGDDKARTGTSVMCSIFDRSQQGHQSTQPQTSSSVGDDCPF